MGMLNAIGTFTATAGVSFGLLKILEDISSKDSRVALSKWLTSDDKLATSSLTVPFLLRAMVVAFLHRIRFVNLIIASTVFSLLATCIVVFLAGLIASPFGRQTPLKILADPNLRMLILIAFASGVIPDALSILKTRLIVLSEAFTKYSGAMMIVDLIASVAIGAMWIVYVAVPLIAHIEHDGPTIYALPNFFTALAPTLLTALLVAYAVVAKFVLRLLRLHVRKTKQFLNFEDKPFQTLGVLVAVLVGSTCTILVGLL